MTLLPLRFRALTPLLAAALFVPAMAANKASADPCGMVPPIQFATQTQSPIRRVGAQQTYVFFKDGVEAIVLRPGFEGDLDNFGMLIPFPSVPGIRKVPDQTFTHLASAIDPPEVIVDLNPRPPPMPKSVSMRSRSMKKSEGLQVRRDEVKVLKEEAVGMYQVAVLAAGSANALKRWMEKNSFVYPTGMDEVTEDYVEIGWVFVAIKTRVGAKSDVNPRPGMTSAKTLLPPGGFTGHVQAMGFRFKVDKPVVPMRLSAFNEGELRNVVYFVGPDAIKIDGIDDALVRRQLTGKQVHSNVVDPLPVRVLGGKWSDIPRQRVRGLTAQRDPSRHNKIARTLLASDLLAVRSGELNNAFEEREKALLNVSERLGLRGPNMDVLHEQALAEERNKVLEGSLEDLDKLSVTVVDGLFPREWIGEHNLTFTPWKMSAKVNHRVAYNARALGPMGEPLGLRYLGDGVLDATPLDGTLPPDPRTPQTQETPWWQFWD